MVSSKSSVPVFLCNIYGKHREGYYAYYCQDCGTTKKVGFTCKSRLCLRCFKVAVDDWLNQAKKVLFEGVIHRQVVLTVPPQIRPLILWGGEFLKVYMDAGAAAVKELVEEWRPKKKIKVGIMAVLQLHGRAILFVFGVAGKCWLGSDARMARAAP